jgi:hypothetical protein
MVNVTEPVRQVHVCSFVRESLIAPDASGNFVRSCIPAKRNVLLDCTEHHPALAQAIGASCLPRASADSATIRCAAVTAEPADGAAEMHVENVRWKRCEVGCKSCAHNVLIARGKGSLQGVRNLLREARG